VGRRGDEFANLVRVDNTYAERGKYITYFGFAARYTAGKP
jgi:hypothetical protein